MDFVFNYNVAGFFADLHTHFYMLVFYSYFVTLNKEKKISNRMFRLYFPIKKSIGI